MAATLITRTCEVCQKEFSREKKQIYGKNRGRFCSRDCARRSPDRKKVSGPGDKNHNWKGGISSNKSRYNKIYRLRYPEKVKAGEAVRRAVKSGKMRRMPCEVCGSSIDIHGHHEDYSKKLDVRWLCACCHRIEHGSTC